MSANELTRLETATGLSVATALFAQLAGYDYRLTVIYAGLAWLGSYFGHALLTQAQAALPPKA